MVNGRTVRDSYIVRNGDVLGDETQSLWLEGAKEEAQESRVEQEAEANAGVTPDTRYWVARVPYPWALLQSDAREDRMAWEVESERKHGQPPQHLTQTLTPTLTLMLAHIPNLTLTLTLSLSRQRGAARRHDLAVAARPGVGRAGHGADGGAARPLGLLLGHAGSA